LAELINRTEELPDTKAYFLLSDSETILKVKNGGTVDGIKLRSVIDVQRLTGQPDDWINERSVSIFMASYDAENENLLDASIGFYSPDGRYDGHIALDHSAEIIRKVVENATVLSLREIYGDCEAGAGEKTLDQIFEIAKREDRTVIAVIDTGIDYNHPDLAYKILRNGNGIIGFDFRRNDDLPYDVEDNGHGTHVSGIAVEGSDDLAVLPIAIFPFNSNRMNRRIYYDAVVFAHKNGARIVNMSFITDNLSSFFRSKDAVEATKWLEEAMNDHPDLLFIAGGGNMEFPIRESFVAFPAFSTNSNLLSVAAVDPDGQLAEWSNYHPHSIDVAAPGVDIESSKVGGGKVLNSGTSMAAPYIANLAGRILFINPSLTPEEVIDIIRQATDPKDHLEDKLLFGGTVNAERALELARESTQTARPR
jgi:hypothetical protein